MNHLSLKLSRHLSSIAPGFEGHWAYVESLIDGKIQIVCAFKRQSWRWANDYKFICPAWQVEDVLRNLSKIFTPNPTIITKEGLHISKMLILWPDSAYQKIEEYLWSVLK